MDVSFKAGVATRPENKTVSGSVFKQYVDQNINSLISPPFRVISPALPCRQSPCTALTCMCMGPGWHLLRGAGFLIRW